MTKIGFYRSDQERVAIIPGLREYPPDRTHFDRVANRCSGTVRLEIAR